MQEHGCLQQTNERPGATPKIAAATDLCRRQRGHNQKGGRLGTARRGEAACAAGALIAAREKSTMALSGVGSAGCRLASL